MTEIIGNSNIDKTNRLTSEICTLTDSNKLEEVISKIILDILENNVSITLSKFHETTSIEFRESGSYKAMIKLHVKDKMTTEDVIWDILHEFGHFLSGKPENKSPSLIREVEAWNRGYLILSNYSDLMFLESNYFAYQTSCLETYFKKLRS